MASSYRKVHYAQRPAKNVERKMMADALARLHRVVDMASVRYVGLGSVYFTDFIVMHRALGLTNMISIEDVHQADIRDRFKANKPFACISLEFGHTNSVLPALFSNSSVDEPSIVWLDFDELLRTSMLTDVATVAQGCDPFSVLAVTVLAESGRDDTTRLAELQDRVGKGKVPRAVQSGADLAGWKTAAVNRKILENEVQRVLRTRNAGLRTDDKIVAHQIFNFRYQDDAKMLTVGWLFARNSDREAVELMNLGELSYTREGDDAFEIKVPRLTVRESLALDMMLPTPPAASLRGVPPADIEAYEQLYRFFPSFVDAAL